MGAPQAAGPFRFPAEDKVVAGPLIKHISYAGKIVRRKRETTPYA